MKTGLFFGSFNPVHVGHMIIAEHMVAQTDLDEVWFVVSPQNPLKKQSSLARDYDRLHLVNLAIGDNPKLRASNIEFGLPRPSYTIDTLTYLKEKHPDKELVLIMGGDNLGTLHKWKNFEIILRDYEIYVYDRPDYDLGEYADHPNVRISESPQIHVSASYIRKCIREDLSVRYLLTHDVWDYIMSSYLYKNQIE
ncbi:MAG: nicotinate (nicotinamide) nucleotide adenylyltransferase [Saprospiraceae bacterium]|nr:nicotinate (nicotinamide) nucleotide adenylyltransferase [Saprospiraceae bacterium]